MIQGRFGNTSGRPYIEALLSIPRLRIVGHVSFLMDTGADTSLLMPIDSRRLSVDFNQLSNTAVSCGIGGVSKQYVEPAIVVFTDPGVFLYSYFIDIRIAVLTPDIEDIPSLLGRDIIDNWIIHYEKPNDILTADVVHSDMQFPINEGSTVPSPNPNTPPAQAPD